MTLRPSLVIQSTRIRLVMLLDIFSTGFKSASEAFNVLVSNIGLISAITQKGW